MHINHKLNLILIILGVSNSILCMQSRALSTITQTTSSHAYLVNITPYDVQMERRKAYQKWCNEPINWNNNSHERKKYIGDINYSQNTKSNNYVAQDAMQYYKQFTKK